MKKITILLLILTSAQSFSQKKFAVFFGINNLFFSENRVFGAQNVEAIFGEQTGILYNMQLNRTISFRPKLMYSQQGDRSEYFVTYKTAIPSDKLSYLNAAMDFKFWRKIYVIAGPQVGFLLSEKPSFETVPAKKIDLGVNLGLGFTIHDWFFEFGGYTALTPVLEFQSQTRTTKLFNAHSKFTVGYYLF